MTVLLSTNTKLGKSIDYNVRGLSFAPHKKSGYNVCQFATDSCINICVLWTRGRTVTPVVRKAMISRTHLFFKDRATFLKTLHRDLNSHQKKLNPACRLNVASDLPWELIDRTIFTNHPLVSFYDYTKSRARFEKYLNGDFPTNYHLTYSWNEKTDNKWANRILKKGGNIAVVMNVKDSFPDKFTISTTNWPVVDGDSSDVRLPSEDGSSVIVGLKAKVSKAKKPQFIRSGFIVDHPWRV